MGDESSETCKQKASCFLLRQRNICCWNIFQHLHQIVEKEMPRGLKKYVEVELFPQIQLSVGKGVSISTACCWLHCEGFQYMQYKKALYYDDHDCPDVVDYQWNVTLPQMVGYHKRLVSYKIGDVGTPILCKIMLSGLWCCCHKMKAPCIPMMASS